MDKSNEVPTLALTEENIAKAFGVLGIDSPELKKSIESDKLEKSLNEEEDEEEKESTEKKDAPEKKEMSEKEEKEESKEIEKSIEPKVEESEKEAKIEKSIETKEVTPKEDDKEARQELVESFEKSIESKMQALGTINLHITQQLEKSVKMLDQLKSVESSISEMDTRVKKSLAENQDRLSELSQEVDSKIEKSLQVKAEKEDTLSKSIQSIEERVEKIEKTPNTRKSVTSLGYVQKSIENDQLDGNKGEGKVLSISRDRSQIVDILLEKSMSGTGHQVNKAYENEVMSFESTNRLSKSIMDDLSKNEGIRFTS